MKIYLNMKRIICFIKKFKCTIIATITCVIAFLVCLFGMCDALNKCASYDKQPPNWTTEQSIIKDYNEAKEAFNDQKQAVADAYNAQIKDINENGLKTKHNFSGLDFNPNIFKKRIRKLKNSIYSNHKENDCFTFDDAQKAEISSSFDKLNDRVKAKIGKVKAFYETRISKVYSALKNGQKIKFSSLTEYDSDNKSEQLSNKDFNAIGSLISKRLNTNDVMKVVAVCVVGMMFFAFLLVTTVPFLADN